MEKFSKFLSFLQQRIPRDAAIWIAGLLAATSPLALVPLGCVSFEDLGRTGTAEPSSSRCGECHAAVYEEWRQSPHARAFVSETFQAYTDGGEVQHCLPCHVPSSLPDGGLERPTLARHGLLEEGVHCLACHRIDADHGAPGSLASGPHSLMAGPLAHDALIQPHAIEARESWFRDSAFCGRCHRDTFEEWRTTSVQPTPTCQECHMPLVRRKVTQASDILSSALVAFESELELKAHTFDASSATIECRQFLGDGFLTLTVDRLKADVRITLQNHLPHALPTGGFGAHTVEVRALVADSPRAKELGDARTVYQKTLRSKRKEALPSGGELVFELPIQNSDGTVLVEVTRVDASRAVEEPLATFDVAEALSRYPDQAVGPVICVARETQARRPEHAR